MPTYIFQDSKTEEVFEKFMTYERRKEYLEENPNIKSLVTAPAIVSGVNHDNKIDDGFKERLSKIGEAHPNSPVGDRYRKNKTIKEVKTQEAVKKHIG